MSRWRDELGSLGYRSPVLVAAMLERVDAAHVEDLPAFAIGWLDLTSSSHDAFAGAWEWSTVEGTLRDLVKLGAVYVVGKPGNSRRPDGRRVRLTVLGRAWLEGELLVDPVEASGDEPVPEGSAA